MEPAVRSLHTPHRLVMMGLVSVLCFIGSGCSVMMASKAPPKKDLSVLSPGVSRNTIIRELGQPETSTKSAEGLTTDVYDFKQGYTELNRAMRLGWHLGADIGTTCLWELAGTPMEMSLQGTPVRAQVTFDPAERAQRIEYFKGAYLRDGRANMPSWWAGDAQQTALLENSQYSGSGIQQASATAPSQQKPVVEHAD